MSDKQRTLKSAIALSGKGLHTGGFVKMEVLPAPENTGIVFRRSDLEGAPEIPALCDYVSDTSRGTTLEKDGNKVNTVEHIVAALWTIGVDNAFVELSGPEVPIMDGSAREFAAAIAEAGLQEQAAERNYYEVREKEVFIFADKDARIEIYPDERFSVSVHIDFNSRVVGNQYADFTEGDDFAGLVAPCRTFVFMNELETLAKMGLIKGGDLDNAIIVGDYDASPQEVERIASLFDKRDIKLEGGYVNNLTLRFDNEIARHKLLDVLGDLALAGVRIKGRIIASKPGHYVNTETAKQLKKNIRRDSARPMWVYDPAKAPVYDINKIKATLPHRPPFLLVDKIFHLAEDSVGGIKNVTMNEPFFVGHFPDEPVMPGVLLLEAMAQCGGILALSKVEEPEKYSTYFLKIDNVRFKQKVVPGDTVQFELKLTEPIRRGIVMMDAKAYVAGSVVAEAFFMAQVTKNRG